MTDPINPIPGVKATEITLTALTPDVVTAGESLNQLERSLAKLEDVVIAARKYLDELRSRDSSRYIYTAVWHPDDDDPVMFAAKTQEALDREIRTAIEDGYEDVVGEPIPDSPEIAVQKYFQACTNKGDRSEWLQVERTELYG